MTSVSPLPLTVDPVAISGRRTPSRKSPSPYLPTTKNRISRSPNKVSRNNTFIAPSRRETELQQYNGGDGEGRDDSSEYHGKVKSSSAGAVEGRRLAQDEVNLVDIFKGDVIKFSEGSEEDQHKTSDDPVPISDLTLPVSSKAVGKKRSAIPVKTKSFVNHPLRSQRSLISGSDSKTIKFLLKLTTKSYFESLKYEIDRIKENDRRVQDQASSHAHSIMALISKGAEFDRKMEELRAQNARLLVETREKDRVQQDTVSAISSELNELKSVCNLLLKNIEKDQELDILARKLRKSKQFDSNTYKMLKSQLRKPIRVKSESKQQQKLSPKLVIKQQSITSLPSRVKSEAALKRQKSRASRQSLVKQKSDWSLLSTMSTVSTGSDMLTDIEVSSGKKSASGSVCSRKLSTGDAAAEQGSTVKKPLKTKKKSRLMKILCCGGRSKSKKENLASFKSQQA